MKMRIRRQSSLLLVPLLPLLAACVPPVGGSIPEPERGDCAPIDVVRVPGAAGSQAPAIIRGRVTNQLGEPERGVRLRIDDLEAGVVTTADGAYRFVVPAATLDTTMRATLHALRIGLERQERDVVLGRGDSLRADFQLCWPEDDIGRVVPRSR